MQAAGIFREIVEYEDAISQFLHHEDAPNEKINEVLRGMQSMENATLNYPE